MSKYARLILVAGLCTTVLLIGSIGGDAQSVRGATAPQQLSVTPTEDLCPPFPIGSRDFQLYMSDQPLGPDSDPPEPREIFPQQIQSVYAIVRTPCGPAWDPSQQFTLGVSVENYFGGVGFDSVPITLGLNQWYSVPWSALAGRSIPSSAYYTNLYCLDCQRPEQIRQQVEWIVGVSVQFDREFYNGEEAVARLTVVDPSVEGDFTTVRVFSDTDPDGISVNLLEVRPGVFSTDEAGTEVGFCEGCLGSSDTENILEVANEDLITAEYLTGEEVFTDEARWYRANYTPTPTWPPSPTPGPPTLTPTPGPSPTGTPVTPSPTPTPTEFPWATIVPMTAEPGQFDVGSVKSDIPDQNLLGTYAVYAGSYNARGQNKLYGAFRFDLAGVPPDAEILKAWLDVVGKSDSHLEPGLGGEWTLKILDGAIEYPWTGGGHPYYPTYRTFVEQAPIAVPAGTPVTPGDLGSEIVNRFTFSPAAREFLETRLSAGQVALRLDGPLIDEFQTFIWYSGYGAGDQDKKPVLHLVYRVFGATWTPSPTPLYTATPTSTATPTATWTPSATPEPTATATPTPPPSINFDQPAYYTDGDEAVIEVVDGRRNEDPLTRETIEAQVRSRTDPDFLHLAISLVETGNDSGRFTGTLRFSTTETNPAESRIHVSDGDWLQASVYSIPDPAEAHWYAEPPTPTPTRTSTRTPTRTSTPTPTSTSTATPTATPPAWVAFNRREYSGENDTAVLTVWDPNANTNGGQVDTVQMFVSSDTDMLGITIEVRETDTSSGLFTTAAMGRNLSFCFLCLGSSEAEGILKVSDGDVLTAYYPGPISGCCRDTARWYLPTPTASVTPTVTYTPSPTATRSATEGRSLVFLPLIMK